MVKESLCSLIYNIGQGAFNRSKLKKALENQDWTLLITIGTGLELMGESLPGLGQKRTKEREQFFKDVNM